MPNKPSFVGWLKRQPIQSICDDAQHRASEGRKEHTSAEGTEAGRGGQGGSDELEPLVNHRGVRPRCMAGARGKAPAVVRS